MSQAHKATHRFLETLARLYALLVARSFADGVQAYQDEFSPLPRAIDGREQDKAVRRILGFYRPSLIKLYNEALAIGLLEHDPAAIDAWFQKNQYRIELALEGMLWSAGEAGYALAAQTAGKLVWWNLDGGAHHCADCPGIADGSPYTYSLLPAVPGDGSTACGGGCRCWLSVH